MNTQSVPSAVQDITLSINLEGKWNLPDNTESHYSILTIPNFSSQNNGVYKFYTNNWDGIEVCAIQIELTTSTAITGMLILLPSKESKQWIKYIVYSGVSRGGAIAPPPPVSKS